MLQEFIHRPFPGLPVEALLDLNDNIQTGQSDLVALKGLPDDTADIVPLHRVGYGLLADNHAQPGKIESVRTPQDTKVDSALLTSETKNG